MEWLRNLLKPLGWVTLVSARVRRRMFVMGRWKSVEFELPTVAILNNLSINSLIQSLRYLDELLENSTVCFLPRLPLLNAGLKLEPIEGGSYTTRLEVNHKVMGYRQSLVLAVSECFVLFPQMKNILVPTKKINFEIRQAANLLLTRADQPFWKERLWPLGNRLESIACLKEMGVIVLLFSKEMDFYVLDRKARELANEDVLVCFVQESESMNLETQQVYYSKDGSEFGSDRDTFVRLFINSLFTKK